MNLFSIVVIPLLSIAFMFLPKRKNLVVFNSYKNKKYNFYARVLFEYFILNKEKLDFDVKFVIDDKVLREELNYRIGDFFIDSKSFSGALTCLRAKFWISSCKPIYCTPFALVNRVKINLWHGTPFKKIAIEDKYQNVLKRAIYKYYYSKMFYDYMICPSDDVASKFSKSFNLPDEKLVVCGSVVGEMFGDSLDINLNDMMDRALKKGRSKKVLYAPTYRDYESTRFFPFSDFDKKDFEKFLEENDITIYIRPHHLDVNYQEYLSLDGIEYLGSDLIPEVTFFLNKFSTLITDYSGVLFDYLLTSGNVILLPYDFDVYRDVRGVNYTINEICSGSVIDDYTNFKVVLSKPEISIGKKVEIKNRFHTVDREQCLEVYKLMKMCNEKYN